ncbi:MAG: alpha/beta hydrolase [Candidatus Edwardsbacteria bacterium]|nr:alpha/beta hydrolase [Candidatus Edwardsbacteria bacterium]
MTHLILIILLVLAVAYAGLSVYALLVSDSMIFYPQPSDYADIKDVITLRTADGVKISALYFKNDAARFALLYSCGNAHNIGGAITDLKYLQHAGFSIFAYDYHGYGMSQGKPSEKAVYMDIDAAYAYLVDSLKVPPSRIIAYGRSLGGAAAVDLAARKPLAGLIMGSSFVAAFRVMTRIPVLPFDKFRNIDKIKRVACPVLVIHGDRDRTIPFWHGKALYDAAPGPKRFLRIEGGDHNYLPQTAVDSYFKALYDFADSLPVDDPTKQ